MGEPSWSFRSRGATITVTGLFFTPFCGNVEAARTCDLFSWLKVTDMLRRPVLRSPKEILIAFCRPIELISSPNLMPGFSPSPMALQNHHPPPMIITVRTARTQTYVFTIFIRDLKKD